ncbi:hypothetical protein IEQ34_015260 [Dendrobium chrysotoxum]|uniref:Uncharacterized protein n=1 Tax=Dendrobium chrysotoxum TaxID=161865 RepID=A0AAV7GHW8_DENCH|nr:hypothetical protein IEQ34_015260 [Dendrobium chrysotoxum]
MEQKEIVQFMYDLQNIGRKNELGEHTYSESKKWIRGKEWVTIQFECCYNYAEKNGIPLGRNGCIINIYDPSDYIPPHIDSYDFVRPFSTMSFLSECHMIFAHKIKIAEPGEFIGSASIPLSVGFVLILNSNGAHLAKHCIPDFCYFRNMDKAKRPLDFKFDLDLQNIKSYDFIDA